MLEELKNKVLNQEDITKEEALLLSRYPDKEALFNASEEIRKKMAGANFDTCSVINARSGKCSENCKWCSQSVFHHTNVKSYELIDEKSCLDMAARNKKYGINRFSIVTSGKAVSNDNLNKLCEYTTKIKKNIGINICASLGLVTKQQLIKMKESGISCCHCNLETSERFFPTLCSTHTWHEKINTLKTAKSIGMKVCSGAIIGLGESMEDRIDMQIMIRNLGIRCSPFNILNPIPGTPLESNKRLSDSEILTTIAVFRFINPTAFIMLAGGRILIKDIEKEALRIGINALIMGDMLTTKGASIQNDFEMIKQLGFNVL